MASHGLLCNRALISVPNTGPSAAKRPSLCLHRTLSSVKAFFQFGSVSCHRNKLSQNVRNWRSVVYCICLVRPAVLCFYSRVNRQSHSQLCKCSLPFTHKPKYFTNKLTHFFLLAPFVEKNPAVDEEWTVPEQSRYMHNVSVSIKQTQSALLSSKCGISHSFAAKNCAAYGALVTAVRQACI